MTREHREALKLAIDRRRRELAADEIEVEADWTDERPAGIVHGRESSYCYHGCRCPNCTCVASQARYARKIMQAVA